jgi:HD-GYP domain-containing protein (c-di-GMP phosphodiesterase class II)
LRFIQIGWFIISFAVYVCTVLQEGVNLGIKQIKIDVNELTLGMFVSGLDRPWTQTPFPLQGFYINTLDEIQLLKVHCHHAFIDIAKGPGPVRTNLRTMSGPSSSGATKSSVKNKVTDVAPIKIQHNQYPVVESLGREMTRARELHQQVYTAIGEVMRQVGTGNHELPIQETKRTASAMVDSVLRSPDAFTWLSRVKEKDEYTYSHAVRCAVWGILFGRHIGLPKIDLDVLALGLLLKDLGKTRLPLEILEKQNRTAAEQSAYEKFVDFGVEILRELPDIKPRITSVVKTHCERLNGTGFPEQLRGDKIPLLGKIAGIVTFYDETTTPRGENRSYSPSKAVARLYEVRDELFQSDLVVEFIRAIGLYPTGTLVELNTGEVAVVVEQNFERRLKPKIMIVLDTLKKPLAEPMFLDLALDEKSKQAKLDAGKLTHAEIERIEIAQDLDPNSYELDVNLIRDIYLSRQSSPNKGFLSFLKSNRALAGIFGGRE